MAEAVRMMAEQGVHAYTYYRSDGTLVRVPGDVGIRRAVREQMRRASSDGALGLAESTGHDLVYIDETPACRDGHRPINGKVFSVTGKTPGYERLTPELESLLHDPGCQHRARLYWPGVTETPEPAWRAEGYTDGEMRELQGTQRALENAVRKAKRSSEALKAAAASEGDGAKRAALESQLRVANSKVRAAQARVAEHVAANPRVLTRQPWREALYDSARRMERSGRKDQRKTLGSKMGGIAGNSVRRVGSVKLVNGMVPVEEKQALANAIRREAVEHVFVITAAGDIYMGTGGAVSVSVDGAPLDGSVVIHNHSIEANYGSVSFGADDWKFVVENPRVLEIWAVNEEHTYIMKPTGKPLTEGDYTEAQSMLRVDLEEEMQHAVMNKLANMGLIEYAREKYEHHS